MRIKLQGTRYGPTRLTWVDPDQRPWSRSECRGKVATSGATYGAPAIASFPGPTECTDALEGIGLKSTKRGMSIGGKEIGMHWNEEGASSVDYMGTITTAGLDEEGTVTYSPVMAPSFGASMSSPSSLGRGVLLD